MKKNGVFILILSLTLLSCVSSLYPVTENSNDIVFKKEIIGRWKDVNGTSEYLVDSITNELGEIYKVIILDHDTNRNITDTSNFLVTMVNIKGGFFLDCMPDTSFAYSHFSDLTRSFILPCHFIIKIYSIGTDYIALSAIDKDALSGLLDNKKITIKHENINKDDVLLTDKPAMLQEKLNELDHFTSVYKKDSLVRVK